MVLRRMGRDRITVHGFRSTAKDWASETTSHADMVSEMALAHTIPEKVQKAYRRGVLIQKRRRLMTDWAKYCSSGSTR
jgi:integrase